VVPELTLAADATVELLGQSGPQPWTRSPDGNGIVVELSARPPTGPGITVKVAQATRAGQSRR